MTSRVINLLNRENEQDTIDSLLEKTKSNNGQLLIIEGPTGIGRTSLLDFLKSSAETSGADVLSARGWLMEQSFPFGVARQLFEQRLTAAPAPRPLLDGAAQLAEHLFDYRDASAFRGSGTTSVHATLHGLYGLCVNLSRRRPLALVLDDAQWSDPLSLRFIHYLANRLDAHPILLALGMRTDAEGRAAEAMGVLAALPCTTVVQPSPLDETSIGQVLATTLGTPVDHAFARECGQVPRGNPFLVHELAHEVAAQGVPPTAQSAARVRTLAPRTVMRRVAGRLDRLPAAAVRLARAVAILGDGADVADVASVAHLPTTEVRAAALPVVTAGILREGTPFHFVHPVVRSAVYAQMRDGLRHSGHRAAAVALAASGASDDRVARHLLRTKPWGDPWTAQTLGAVGRRALLSGAPADAMPYLRRALAESVPPHMRRELLTDLGTAALQLRDPEAVAHLYEALKLATEPGQRAAIGLPLARALVAASRYQEATTLLNELRRSVDDEDPLSLRLDAEFITTASLVNRTRDVMRERLQRLGRRAGGRGPDEGLLRVHRVLGSLLTGTSADRAARRVQRIAEEVEWAAAGDSELGGPCLAAWVLVVCDRLPEAERLLDSALCEMPGRQFPLTARAAAAVRATVLYGRGRLADAEHEAHAALTDVRGEGLMGSSAPLAAAVLVHVHVERGELLEAEKVLADTGFADAVPQSLAFAPLLEARGRLRLTRERLPDGLADLAASRRMGRGLRCPALTAWWHGAMALIRQQRHAEAASFAADELRAARALGERRPLAVALRTMGLVEGGPAGLEHLRQATELLENSPALLERALTLVEFGAALRRQGQRAMARRVLRSGLELAETCGAVPLCQRADTELMATGVRGGSGRTRTRLTPSESRVAKMAAEGMRNQEIALSLFVSVKTVEWHLSQVYRKLSITSRTELLDALGRYTSVPAPHGA